MQNFKVTICAFMVLAAIGGETPQSASAEEIPYTILENHTERAVDHAEVERLFREVANILGITVNRELAPPRVIITAPEDLQELYRKTKAFLEGHYSAGLYLPDNYSIIVTTINRFDLGHEFAHYFAHLYFDVSRKRSEEIARDVELELAIRHPLKRR